MATTNIRHLPWCSRISCRCKPQAYIIGIAIAGLLSLYELWGSHASESRAMLVDFFHLLSDSISYLIGLTVWILARVSLARANAIDRVGGNVNALALLVVALIMFFVTIRQITSPDQIDTDLVLKIAPIVMIGEIAICTVLFLAGAGHAHGHSHRAALAHAVVDLLGTIIVYAAAWVQHIFHQSWTGYLDDAGALLICGLLAYVAYDIRKHVLQHAHEEAHEHHACGHH